MSGSRLGKVGSGVRTSTSVAQRLGLHITLYQQPDDVLPSWVHGHPTPHWEMLCEMRRKERAEMPSRLSLLLGRRDGRPAKSITKMLSRKNMVQAKESHSRWHRSTLGGGGVPLTARDRLRAGRQPCFCFSSEAAGQSSMTSWKAVFASSPCLAPRHKAYGLEDMGMRDSPNPSILPDNGCTPISQQTAIPRFAPPSKQAADRLASHRLTWRACSHGTGGSCNTCTRKSTSEGRYGTRRRATGSWCSPT